MDFKEELPTYRNDSSLKTNNWTDIKEGDRILAVRRESCVGLDLNMSNEDSFLSLDLELFAHYKFGEWLIFFLSISKNKSGRHFLSGTGQKLKTFAN